MQQMLGPEGKSMLSKGPLRKTAPPVNNIHGAGESDIHFYAMYQADHTKTGANLNSY